MRNSNPDQLVYHKRFEGVPIEHYRDDVITHPLKNQRHNTFKAIVMENQNIEDILDRYKNEAAILERRGHTNEAHLITSICQDVITVLDEYITWLSESTAQLRSGHGVPWLRDKFPAWEAAGHARMRAGKREYRLIIIPQRRHAEEVAA